MTLVKLDILSVRNINRLQLTPSPALNFIVGPNASGKSALLEAIYILGRARSFRTSSVKQAISFDNSELIVSAKVEQAGHNLMQLGIQIGQHDTQIHIDGENKRRSDLVYSLPLQLIHPKSFQLLDGSPQFRREFLDWGVFNQQPSYLSIWRKFNKALKQRNSLLKNRRLNQIDVWNRELVEYGHALSDFRQNYLEQLESFFWEVCQEFSAIDGLKLKFITGWSADLTLEQSLQQNIERDLRYGFTSSGPHRSNFQLLFNNKNVKDYFSRGQLKLLLLSLKLAQVQLLSQSIPNTVCILIDDLTAELDTFNRVKLVNYLSRLNSQIFMTSTELAEFGNLDAIQNYKVFHVEHGCFKSM